MWGLPVPLQGENLCRSRKIQIASPSRTGSLSEQRMEGFWIARACSNYQTLIAYPLLLFIHLRSQTFPHHFSYFRQLVADPIYPSGLKSKLRLRQRRVSPVTTSRINQDMHVVIRMEDKQKSVGNSSSDVRDLANIIRSRVPVASIKWFVKLRRCLVTLRENNEFLRNSIERKESNSNGKEDILIRLCLGIKKKLDFFFGIKLHCYRIYREHKRMFWLLNKDYCEFDYH